MRWTMVALLGSALVARSALAEPEMTFTVEATKKGVPIPQSEIKIVPSAFGRSRKGHGPPPPQPGHGAHRKTRRANPTANSANWCGSVNTTPSNDQITVIHGSFTHPGCTKRTGQSYPQAAASWVGIDGDSWTSALLQAGTVCIFDNSTASVRAEAWWQWVPSGAYTISSMPVAVDDWFEITINTTSTTAATVKVTNLSQATSYTISITNGATLARVNADWVIERPYYGASLAGFPTFTDVWFYEAWTTRTGGTGLGILGAKQYQIPSLCASEEWDDEHQVSWSL